jgi:hypothetical protein
MHVCADGAHDEAVAKLMRHADSVKARHKDLAVLPVGQHPLGMRQFKPAGRER